MLTSSALLPPFSAPGNHGSFASLCSFSSSRMPYGWNHTACRVFVHLGLCILRFFYFPHHLMVFFLSFFCSFLRISEQCSVVWLHYNLSLHLLEDILAASKFWQSQETAVNIRMQGFVGTKVLSHCLNTPEQDCWTFMVRVC